MGERKEGWERGKEVARDELRLGEGKGGCERRMEVGRKEGRLGERKGGREELTRAIGSLHAYKLHSLFCESRRV